MHHMENNHRFQMVRWIMFTLLAALFLLSFFYRFAAGAFAEGVTESFRISAAELGMLSSLVFYMYTLMQIPSGFIVDRWGTRKVVAAGAVITGAGSVWFGVAPNFWSALIGPVVIGIGISTTFVGMMKFNSKWFQEQNYGLVSGITVLLGNFGAVLGGQPLAQLLESFFWREIYVALGIFTIGLAVLGYRIIRDSPEEAGFRAELSASDEKSPSARQQPRASEGSDSPVSSSDRQNGMKDVITIGTSPVLWLIIITGIGTNATFYTFSGLWGIPLLRDGFGLTNAQAAFYTTLALIAYGAGSISIGWFSDKLGLRKPFVVGSSLLSLAGWIGLAFLPWSSGWSGMLLYIVVGTAGAQIVIAFALVKESMPARISGLSLAYINAGIFLAVAVLQPLFGWMMELVGQGAVIDGISVYDLASYKAGLRLFVVLAVIGTVGSFFLRETYCKNIER